MISVAKALVSKQNCTNCPTGQTRDRSGPASWVPCVQCVRMGHVSRRSPGCSFAAIHKHDANEIPYSQIVAARFVWGFFWWCGFWGFFWLLFCFFGSCSVVIIHWYTFSPRILAFLILRTSIIFLFYFHKVLQQEVPHYYRLYQKVYLFIFRCTSWQFYLSYSKSSHGISGEKLFLFSP